MDVVYILGTGSLADNLELTYSVRSLSEYMLDLRNIYVVGEKPEDLPNVIHIPANDPSIYKAVNARHKILVACKIPELSEDFFLMNDDFFMTEPFMGADFPNYALKGSNGGNDGIHCFQVHCPKRYNKTLYPVMPFPDDPKGRHSPANFYHNFFQSRPTFTDEFVLNVGKDPFDVEERIKTWPCFSIGDHAMTHQWFVEWLTRKYPFPSRFE